MKYLHYTYVDAVTGISVDDEPAVNGPKPPDVDGLIFEWARESRYPTEKPDFFGTCPDDSFVSVPGVRQVLSQTDYEQMWRDELSARKVRAITMRQARLQLLALGVLDTVSNAISSMGQAAQIEWEYAAEVERSNPLVAGIQQLLEWTDEQLDTYFREAAKL